MTARFFVAVLLLWTTAAHGTMTAGDIFAASEAFKSAMAAEDYEKAALEGRRAYEGAEALWGARPDTALLAASYAEAILRAPPADAELLSGGREAEAATLFRRCADILTALHGPWDFEAAYCLFGQTIADGAETAPPETADALRRALAYLEPIANADERATPLLNTIYWRLAIYESAHASVAGDNAVVMFERAASHARKARGAFDRGDELSVELYGHSLLIEGRYYEAIEDYPLADQLYREAYSTYAEAFGEIDGRTLMTQEEVQRAGILAIEKELDAKERRQNASGNPGRAADCRFVDRNGEEIEICPKSRKPARFPESVLSAYRWGYVLVEFDLDANGKVANAHATRSWPPGIFDKAAVTAVNKWKYHPPIVADGETRPANSLEALLRFQISDGRPIDY